MSPFERHDETLRDMVPGGGSGQGAPDDEELDLEPDDLDGDPPTDEAELDDEIQQELVEEEQDREEVKSEATAGSGPRAITRLYRGETSFDFVGRRRWWYLISGLVIVAGLVSLSVRGLNLGIDFKGGTAWIVKSSVLTQSQVEHLVSKDGLSTPVVEVLGSGGHRTVEVQADLNSLSKAQRTRISTSVTASLAGAAHVSKNTVSITSVGPTWGSQVTQRAVIALIVFFVVVAAYISIRFEPKMALAAFIAMVHDLLVTVGIFSLTGFQVSPDTVIAVLTILGYSLYDTVVVFDRVRDNSKGFGASGRMTYSEMVNLSMNQTLARSMNTSLVAILPVLSVLLVGAELLGAKTLQDYGLALTVGLISGAYSSIFIASPILARLKEREPRYSAIRQRLESRGERFGLLTPAAAALAMGGAGGGSVRSGAGFAGTNARSGGNLRPGAGRGKSRPAGSSNAVKNAVKKGNGAGTTAAGGARGAGPATAKDAAANGALLGAAPGTNGATGSSRGSTANGAGRATKTGGQRQAGVSGSRRPPPRPRKGGGKSKGKKRR